VCTAPHEDRAAAHLCGALNSLQRYNRTARAGRDRCIPHCVRNTSHCRPPLNRSLPKQIRLVGDLMVCPWWTSFGVACTLDFPRTRTSKLKSSLGRSVDPMLNSGTRMLVKEMPRRGPTMLPDCSLPAEPLPQRRLGLSSPSAAYRRRRAGMRRSGSSGSEVRLSASQAIYFALQNSRAAHSLLFPDACPRIAQINSV
jgi:hypothetical protein